MEQWKIKEYIVYKTRARVREYIFLRSLKKNAGRASPQPGGGLLIVNKMYRVKPKYLSLKAGSTGNVPFPGQTREKITDGGADFSRVSKQNPGGAGTVAQI